MSHEVDLGSSAITPGKGRIDPYVPNNARIDAFRVSRVVQVGDHRGQSTDMTACTRATGDDAIRIDTQFLSMLLEPADCTLRIRDAYALDLRSARREFVRLSLAHFEHLVIRRGTDEPTTGKVGTGPAELRQRTAEPGTAMKENYARHFRLRWVVIRRKEDLHLPFLPAGYFIDVGYTGTLGVGWFFSGKRRTAKRCSEEGYADH